MRLATWGASALVLAAALSVAMRTARADDDAEGPRSSHRLVVDRIEHQPASITGTRLQITFSALTLQGQRIELTDPKAIQAFAGASQIKAPYALGQFENTHDGLALVVVIQATLDYSEVLPVVTETLSASLLSKLPDETQLAILPYGDSTGSGKLSALKTARAKLGDLTHDGSAGDPALLETIERALTLLRKVKAAPDGGPLRKMILVISDGRDRAGDRDRVTRVGKRAGKEGVRIHSFAHSPPDQRRPLLLLGELSRRSLGTFRWLQRGKADSWTPAFTQMHDEIVNQYVLTYFLDADSDPGGRKLRLETVGRTLTSSADRQTDLKIPRPECGGEECAGYCVSDRCVVPRAPEGRGVFGWVLLIGGIVVGAMVVLGLIGYAMSKRSPSIPYPPGMLPPGVMPPGGVPPGGVPGVMPGVVPGSVPPGAMPGMPNVMPGMPGVMPGMPGVAPARKRWWQRRAAAPRMPGAVPGVPASFPPAAAAAPRALMFLSGPRTGERLVLRHGFMIGKAPGCDLLIEDGYTSGHHAQISVDPAGNCRLYDRGSTNGTFVNGVRVTESALEHGVTIRIGSTELRFLAE